MLALISINRENVIQIKVSSGNKLTVGRSSRCDFKLDDPRCSSIHCSLRLEKNGRLVIKDLGSSNGTFVNEHLVQETFIYLNDQVKIGDTIFILDQSKMSKLELEIHTSDVKTHQVKGINMPVKRASSSIVKKKEEPEEITLELGKKQLERQKQIQAHNTRMANLKKIQEQGEGEEEEDTGTSNLLDKLKNIFKK